MVGPKGQLISKQNCWAVTSPRRIVSWVRFVCFLGEVMALQFCFEIYWPLKSKIFGQESTYVKEKKLKIPLMVRQKLGMISEINYFQNWIYQKKCLTKVGVLNWYSSLKSFLERFRQFLTLKINFQIPILVFFDEQIHQQNFLNFFPLSMLILWIRVKHALARPRTPSHALSPPSHKTTHPLLAIGPHGGLPSVQPVSNLYLHQ